MTIIEAIDNALALLESNGFVGGDVHDDLALSAMYLRTRYSSAAQHELGEEAQ